MTKISWTDITWNFVVGCSRISPGCINCYAAAAAKTGRLQQFPQYQAVSSWNGTVKLVDSQLDKPLKRRKATKFFACSMSDLFHESIPFELIDMAFGIMALCPQHIFQILTKRPERMLEWSLTTNPLKWSKAVISSSWDKVSYLGGMIPIENSIISVALKTSDSHYYLDNVWMGTTTENQQTADRRIPLLLQVPAKIRFLSCEPLLEAINLKLGAIPVQNCRFSSDDGTCNYPDKFTPECHQWDCPRIQGGIDWVICGGESGKGARLCESDWLHAIARQCQAVDIPVFVKQLGSNSDYKTKDRKGSDMSEFPESLQIQQFP